VGVLAMMVQGTLGQDLMLNLVGVEEVPAEHRFLGDMEVRLYLEQGLVRVEEEF